LGTIAAAREKVSSGSDSGCVKTHQARKYGDWYFSDQAKLGTQEQRREFIALWIVLTKHPQPRVHEYAMRCIHSLGCRARRKQPRHHSAAKPEPHLWPGMGVGALILEISARHKSKRALTTTVVIGPFEWSG
jgi:hypothetical protein